MLFPLQLKKILTWNQWNARAAEDQCWVLAHSKQGEIYLCMHKHSPSCSIPHTEQRRWRRHSVACAPQLLASQMHVGLCTRAIRRNNGTWCMHNKGVTRIRRTTTLVMLALHYTLGAQLVGCMVVGRLIRMEKISFFVGYQTRGVSSRWPTRTLKHLWARPHGNVGISVSSGQVGCAPRSWKMLLFSVPGCMAVSHGMQEAATTKHHGCGYHKSLPTFMLPDMSPTYL
jgi:hypothetical protein